MTPVRVRLARAVAFLSIGLLAVGCTAVTGGKAQAPPRLMPRSLTGQTIRQVLLDGGTLSRILKEPFIINRRLPPRFGGPEAMQDLGSASRVDCLGVDLVERPLREIGVEVGERPFLVLGRALRDLAAAGGNDPGGEGAEARVRGADGLLAAPRAQGAAPGGAAGP